MKTSLSLEREYWGAPPSISRAAEGAVDCIVMHQIFCALRKLSTASGHILSQNLLLPSFFSGFEILYRQTQQGSLHLLCGSVPKD